MGPHNIYANPAWPPIGMAGHAEPMGGGFGRAAFPHPYYHGAPPYPHPHAQGFCHSCCHPVSRCVCGQRECRKEAKELLASDEQETSKGRLEINKEASGLGISEAGNPKESSGGIETPAAGAAGHPINTNVASVKEAFIGGGCCVHLSIEYTSTSESSMVSVRVQDAEGTLLGWTKQGVKPGYYIKEGIITTNPGAKLRLSVKNVTARVRWCEVFSC